MNICFEENVHRNLIDFLGSGIICYKIVGVLYEL